MSYVVAAHNLKGCAGSRLAEDGLCASFAFKGKAALLDQQQFKFCALRHCNGSVCVQLVAAQSQAHLKNIRYQGTT